MLVPSAWTLPVFEIMHRPGQMRERQVDVPVADDMGNAMIAVKAGTEVHLDVRLESLHDGILVSGSGDTVADGECGRCLIEVELPVEVEFQELFAYSPEDAVDYTVHDDHVDCEPVVRDAVVLALPFQPVCRDDCPGLDPETGEKLSGRAEQKQREVIDPRWAALEGFRAGETDTD